MEPSPAAFEGRIGRGPGTDSALGNVVTGLLDMVARLAFRDNAEACLWGWEMHLLRFNVNPLACHEFCKLTFPHHSSSNYDRELVLWARPFAKHFGVIALFSFH